MSVSVTSRAKLAAVSMFTILAIPFALSFVAMASFCVGCMESGSEFLRRISKLWHSVTFAGKTLLGALGVAFFPCDRCRRERERWVATRMGRSKHKDQAYIDGVDHQWFECVADHKVSPESPPERVSRNAPCPCGSGRKHKKCCGGRR